MYVLHVHNTNKTHLLPLTDPDPKTRKRGPEVQSPKEQRPVPKNLGDIVMCY